MVHVTNIFGDTGETKKQDFCEACATDSEGGGDRGTCDYCGAPAVAVSICYAIPGVMDEEVHRWCERCQQDLSEFALRPENQLPDDVDLDDDAAMEREALRRADIERRRKEFMRQRVKERTQQ